MVNTKSVACLMAVFVAQTSGCSSNAEGDPSVSQETNQRATLALVEGTVTSEDGVTATEGLSLAILWAPRIDAPATASGETVVPPWVAEAPDDRDPSTPRTPDRTARTVSQVFTFGARWVSQSINLGSTFPLRFVLPIDAVPPIEAQLDLATLGGEGRIATGVLVAYEDGDGDGRFSLGNASTPSPDRLRASSWTDLDPSAPGQFNIITFLDGTLPTESLPQVLGAGFLQRGAMEGVTVSIPQGFGVMSYTIGMSGGPRVATSGPDADVPLRLTDLPRLGSSLFQMLACTDYSNETRYHQGPPVDLVGAEMSCINPNNLEFSYQAERTDACRSTFHVGVIELPAGSAAPANYPTCN